MSDKLTRDEAITEGLYRWGGTNTSRGTNERIAAFLDFLAENGLSIAEADTNAATALAERTVAGLLEGMASVDVIYVRNPTTKTIRVYRATETNESYLMLDAQSLTEGEAA